MAHNLRRLISIFRSRIEQGFEKWPDWLKEFLIMWSLVCAAYLALGGLRTSLPYWIEYVMAVPYAIVLVAGLAAIRYGSTYRRSGGLLHLIRKVILRL